MLLPLPPTDMGKGFGQAHLHGKSDPIQLIARPLGAQVGRRPVDYEAPSDPTEPQPAVLSWT